MSKSNFFYLWQPSSIWRELPAKSINFTCDSTSLCLSESQGKKSSVSLSEFLIESLLHYASFVLWLAFLNFSFLTCKMGINCWRATFSAILYVSDFYNLNTIRIWKSRCSWEDYQWEWKKEGEEITWTFPALFLITPIVLVSHKDSPSSKELWQLPVLSTRVVRKKWGEKHKHHWHVKKHSVYSEIYYFYTGIFFLSPHPPCLHMMDGTHRGLLMLSWVDIISKQTWSFSSEP